MTSSNASQFIERTLSGHIVGRVTLLAAIEMPSVDTTRNVALYFSKTSDVNAIIVNAPWTIAASITVDGALKIDITANI